MSRHRKHANATARAQSSRAEMLAKGWKPVQVWLSPSLLDRLGPDKTAEIRRLIEQKP